VSCLKIEGRLKDPAYVAATTRAYRNAVDEAWEAYCQKHNIIPNNKTARRGVVAGPEIITREELAQVFSRGQDEQNNGLTPGFFEGSMHQRLVRGRSPRHRGVHVGRVEEGSNFKRGLIVSSSDGALEDLLKPGDGIVIDRGMAQEEELGGSIYEIQQERNGRVAIHFSRDTHQNWKKYDDHVRNGSNSAVPLAPAGAHVWKTSDAVVDKKLKRLSEVPAQKLTAEISVVGTIGAPLEISIRDASGRVGIGKTQGNLEPAEGSGLADKSIIKAIGKLGNTQWTVDQDTIDTSELEEGAWCPVSWIKEARRVAVEDLESKVASGGDSDGVGTQSLAFNVVSDMLGRERESDHDAKDSAVAKISVLARNYEQVDRICLMSEDGEEIDEIIIDFLEVDGMREAVERIRKAGVRTVVASPRIIKPGESGIWRTLLQLQPDGLLVRSTGLLYRMMKLGGAGAEIQVKSNGEMHKVTVPELIGDFSLNVANALTAWELLDYGCSRVTASYDLSANAITELLETLGEGSARNVEVIAHTHIPIFHTEHCVFARFLTKGNSYVDCGHVCTRHNVHLRDQSGADNLVLADMGCRNTVFSATAQSGVHSLKEWIAVGGERFRIELVDESPDDVEVIVRGYIDVLNGDAKPREVWMALEEVRDSNGKMGGVSHGSLRNKVERRAGEIA
jgi:putative protease